MKTANAASANLVEFFTSLQGEGALLGREQLFIRFAGCQLRCGYCDTPRSHHFQDDFRCETKPWSRQFIRLPNPISVPALAELCDQTGMRSLALTGGEPLEQGAFLKKFLKLVGDYEVLLETNGVEDAALVDILEDVDCVSMDLKVSSATGEPERWQEHRRFLARAAASGKLSVKLVARPAIPEAEFSQLRDLLQPYPTVPLFLQPTWPMPEAWALAYQSLLARLGSFHPQVFLRPQMHKFWQVL